MAELRCRRRHELIRAGKIRRGKVRVCVGDNKHSIGVTREGEEGAELDANEESFNEKIATC